MSATRRAKATKVTQGTKGAFKTRVSHAAKPSRRSKRAAASKTSVPVGAPAAPARAPDFARANGLVPAIAQDATTGAVLMLAWMDREAWDATIATGDMHFHSRSRDRLWRKGEASGNALRVVSLHVDCDADAVLALVEPSGPACHTGEATCWHEPGHPERAPAPPLEHLARVLRERTVLPVEGSHTSRLLADENLRLKKVAEEAAELIMAARGGTRADVAEEAADVLYHALVAAHAAGVAPKDVLKVLRERRK